MSNEKPIGNAKSGTIEILYKAGGSGKRNNEPFVVLYWSHIADWPDRVRRSRGWYSWKEIWRRPMTEEELLEQNCSYRAICYKYKSAQDLVKAESKILTEEHPEINYLKQMFNL